MKIRNYTTAILFILTFAAVGAHAQFGGLINKIEKAVDKGTKKADGANIRVGGNNGGGSIGGGCSASRPSGPPIGNQPITERTPGCPSFVGLSKAPIDPKNLKATQWATEFKSGDPIYGIIFTDGPLEKWGQPGATDDLGLSLNLDAGTEPGDENSYFGGEFSSSARIKINPEMRNQNYATFAYMPSPALPMSSDDIANGYLFLQSLGRMQKPAKLYASVKMIGWSPAPSLAPIVIDLSGGTQAYMAMKGEMNKGMGKVLGSDKVMMPASGMKNPQLENRILTMENTGRASTNTRVLRVVITDRDWTPLRHELTGVLIGRVIQTSIAYRDEEGVCWRRMNTYNEDYNGRTYTNLKHQGMRETAMIACENVSK